SLPYNGSTRAVLIRQNGGTGGPFFLVDFTPGVGVSNPRQLTGNLAPWMDLTFTFSNNPATPYYAYVSSGGGSGGGTIRRFDIRTMTEVRAMAGPGRISTRCGCTRARTTGCSPGCAGPPETPRSAMNRAR